MMTARFVVLVLLLLTLCLPVRADAAEARLLVFAAASLKNAMDGVVQRYEAGHDVDVRISYAGSSTLARQIERGAPADVYVSANKAWMDRLENEGHIDSTSRVALLGNSLVLVASTDSDVQLPIVPGFAIVDALDGGYLAMANIDAVPAGIYGGQALESLDVWDALQGHIVQVDDVRAALALVARGEAPLGVVYASDAVAEKRVRVVGTFPQESHAPIVYPAALLAHVDEPSARAFMRFLKGGEATRIFHCWGFRVTRSDAR